MSIEDKYEAITEFADAATATRVKAAALYNAGTFSATPELVGQDIYQQEALLEVMFQEQRVFLDALLHSLAMEDPFLLLAMIRDGIRFMTLGETALKSAVRIDPADMDIRRNLELIQKGVMPMQKPLQIYCRKVKSQKGQVMYYNKPLWIWSNSCKWKCPKNLQSLKKVKMTRTILSLKVFNW